eukprot:gene16727-19881_t
MIGAQIVLIVALVVGSVIYWPYYVTNIVLGFFILVGAIGFAIFGKMIWKEYKDLSSKDCGVFSQNTHSKIQKVTKLSAAAIIVTFLTFCVLLWSFVEKYPLTVMSLIAFSIVGRAIEVSWIVSMLLVLSPSLQTWGPGHTSGKVSQQHFDDLSDSSIDIENDEVISSSLDSSTKTVTTDINSTSISDKSSDLHSSSNGGSAV